jgi:class 3 adenylate cyclase/tetratricopeptide (TPR) repeat protein
VPIQREITPRVEERKTVTVLFCDLVGFTVASDQADPEDIQARIRPFRARLRGEIELFGGTVEKFIGDAVMAVFGAPVVHEDDPERAVRAGLRILEAISDLNQSAAGLDLRVRIGIETGEAVVAVGARLDLGEGIVTGDVVNTASRLQGAAPVNGVVVGTATYQATKEIFEYEALAPVALKGKSGEVAIFHAKAARARLGVDLMRSFGSPMVGRQIDLGLVTGAFEKAVQEPAVQLVMIVGEPGVGKSRLVAELASYVDSRSDLVRWRQGRCLPYGEGITFWALGEIVKAEAGILETDAPRIAGEKIDAVIPDGHQDAAWLRQRLRPLVGLEAPEAGRHENFAAWRAFLELLAEANPCVFVFEDLHWADDALLAFIDHLAHYAMSVPMLLLGTARPELYERAQTLGAMARNVARVNLVPLSETETARLISNLLESGALPADVQQAILEQSGGNPLYAEEFVRLLKDRRILTKRGSAWSIERDDDIPLPSGVRGLVAARLDMLSPERKRLLQDAAVVGKVFWSEAVAEMGRKDLGEVHNALHELARRELVRPTRQSSMEGESEYSFAHAVVREVCYAEIPRRQRAERHRLAAGWIEKVAAERVEDYAEILAAHYTTALDFAQATSEPLDADLAADALRYVVLSGERALGMDAGAAERHYVKALAMARADDPMRADILARYGEALLHRGEFLGAARAYQDAIAAFRSRGDITAAATAMCRQVPVLNRLGDNRYRDVAAEALLMLERFGPSAALVQALATQAAARRACDENRDAIVFAERAITVAEELGLPKPVVALGFRGTARFALGDAGGLRDMREALETAKAQGLGRDAGVLYNNLAEDVGRVEGPRRRLEWLREGVRFVERRGMVERVLALETQTVEALLDLGLVDDAATLAERLAHRMEAGDDVGDLLELRAAQSRILTRRGDVAAAVPIVDWIVERARKIKDPQFVAITFPPAAAVAIARRDARTAVALLAEVERTTNIRGTAFYVESLPEMVRCALDAADADLAARLVSGLEPLHALHQDALLTAHALLAEHQAEHVEAAAMFGDAAKRWARLEMPWERAHALFGQGRCLLALRSTAEAISCARSARELFVSVGATPSVVAVDALLEHIAPM